MFHNTVIYIHGFGSSGLGSKAVQFRNFFNSKKTENILYLAPSLHYNPQLTISTLEEIILNEQKQKRSITLIGSSLGGFYALYLGEKYKLKTILINPSTEPYITLKETKGISYQDNSEFEWKKEYLEYLKTIKIEKNSNKVFLLLQKGDELLDYKKALESINSSFKIVEEGGNHQFQAIGRHLEKILDFIKE